jgi:hypothetical protein
MGVLLTADNIRAAAPMAAAAPTVPLVPDDAVQRLVKLIPGEAAALYTAAVAMADARALPPVAFVLALAVLLLSLRREGMVHTPPVKPPVQQYVFRSLAFAAWAFAIRNPLAFAFEVPSWIPAVAIIFIPALGALVIGGDGDAAHT